MQALHNAAACTPGVKIASVPSNNRPVPDLNPVSGDVNSALAYRPIGYSWLWLLRSLVEIGGLWVVGYLAGTVEYALCMIGWCASVHQTAGTVYCNTLVLWYCLMRCVLCSNYHNNLYSTEYLFGTQTGRNIQMKLWMWQIRSKSGVIN